MIDVDGGRVRRLIGQIDRVPARAPLILDELHPVLCLVVLVQQFLGLQRCEAGGRRGRRTARSTGNERDGEGETAVRVNHYRHPTTNTAIGTFNRITPGKPTEIGNWHFRSNKRVFNEMPSGQGSSKFQQVKLVRLYLA